MIPLTSHFFRISWETSNRATSTTNLNIQNLRWIINSFQSSSTLQQTPIPGVWSAGLPPAASGGNRRCAEALTCHYRPHTPCRTGVEKDGKQMALFLRPTPSNSIQPGRLAVSFGWAWKLLDLKSKNIIWLHMVLSVCKDVSCFYVQEFHYFYYSIAV